MQTTPETTQTPALPDVADVPPLTADQISRGRTLVRELREVALTASDPVAPEHYELLDLAERAFLDLCRRD